MQESNARTVGAMTNPWLDDLDTLIFGTAQRRRKIRGRQTDVVYPGSTMRKEPGDRRVFVERLEQFDSTGRLAEEHDSDSFRGNFHRGGRVLSEQRSEGGYGLREGIDRDSDVVDTVHALSPVVVGAEGVAEAVTAGKLPAERRSKCRGFPLRMEDTVAWQTRMC